MPVNRKIQVIHGFIISLCGKTVKGFRFDDFFGGCHLYVSAFPRLRLTERNALTGAELFTYNVSSRESHPASQEDADNRAIIGAEGKIREEFPGALQDYLND
jgi:hypothetical protein